MGAFSRVSASTRARHKFSQGTKGEMPSVFSSLSGKINTVHVHTLLSPTHPPIHPLFFSFLFSLSLSLSLSLSHTHTLTCSSSLPPLSQLGHRMERRRQPPPFKLAYRVSDSPTGRPNECMIFNKQSETRS